MTSPIDPQTLLRSILNLLEETFDTHHGIFLDKGTSLFATLDKISAEQASRPMGAGGATVAAHVTHVDFYLEVVLRYMETRDATPVDWRAIWNDVRGVTPEEWDALRAKLRASYARARGALERIGDWNDSDTINDALAIIVHTASHLGAIRQGLRCLT
ncbi:MAG: DinB family protein [Candidatus Eisenbacteria bacterium]